MLIASMLLLLLAACNAVPVERVPLAQPIIVPADARPAPVLFRGLRYAVPLGTTTVGMSVRNLSCELGFARSQKRVNLNAVPADDYRRVFGESLGSLGYDVAGNPDRIFDAEADEERATYSVAGRVTDIKIDGCREKGSAILFDYDAGIVGEAMIQVEWTVFDALDQRNAYRVTTRGYAKLDEPSDEAQGILLSDAFAAAAHNLGADRNFYELLVNGVQPPNPGTVADPEESPLSGDRTPITLPSQPLRHGDAATAMDELRRSVVMIQTAAGFGSGFFISDDGLILTDRHVVGKADRVRVVTADKKFHMTADVLRTDPKRDVALLRVTDRPADLQIAPLPLRREKPAIAEDVYAIGTPDLTRLQDTVTKGIVSAIRFDRHEKQWYIQSDVFTYPGNSGGPLLDAHGNILGLCVSGYTDGTWDLTGLNLFIPIDDALKALDVQ